MEGSTILGLIPARGGSKDIPGKNLALLGGRPLLAWTAAAAQASAALSRVILSTDDEEILNVGLASGLEVPFRRPAELATDSADTVGMALHAVDWLQRQEGWLAQNLVLLQPTSPFRLAADIDRAVEILWSADAPAVVSVAESPYHPLLASHIEDSGILSPFVSDSFTTLRRQELAPVYYPNGAIYAIRTATLRKERTFYPEGVYAYVMPRERSVDIDTPWDLQLARALAKVASDDLA